MIESILTFAIVIWFGGLSKRDEEKLHSVTRAASRIIGLDLPSLDEVYANRLRKKVKKILEDRSHPSHNYFELLPSGRRYRTFRGTSRFLNSMYPRAVGLLNENIG